ncbi:valine--tRNA ligase [Paraconexibacter algicola]|uniref:Valine--tRNA ligase n=1 Tax=Paraconexibacter algicola TaxID=2133960 RepID=A0A2T4UER6_9ACTN|nr:valine--tRNA ligase [Paraconexibacter algicola]PTL56287.1 valine--tRNA ligase [Paraconexibacter algicola]
MTALQDRKRFEPSEVEPRITQAWLAAGLHHPEPQGTSASNYSIAIPPPNVTGALHMGHALNGAIQDTLVRWQRMHGRLAKWILGTDHAGIATQTQVEKLLVREGTSREEVGREEFTRRVWEWREQYGGTIVGQFERLGSSCDYDDERFTLDDQYVRAVLKVFVDLYEQGLIYRDLYMVNWDPGSGSAISDLEVEDREVTDTLYSIAYPLTDGSGEVVVATVRPETMLADTAVAVNPQDERFAHLVGRTVRLPLTDRELTIIADDYVKTDFGTGCLKITPGHDPNDFEIGRRHGLQELTAIGEDGRIVAELGGPYAGLKALEAREAMVADLRAQGLVRAEEPYTHTVPFSHRSGERIEPLISLQWFMRMDELAAPAIEVVRDGTVRIHPETQARRYVEWLENIRPWCISRQLWWGHQIPVWYRGDEVHAGLEAPEGEGWERDPDVLDTWFSSALWPFATLGWPDETPELAAFYPTDVLSTARDILFLWVARMVMMGLRFTGDVPFRDVYIHSVIQAPDGRRMSKSLGTGINPLDLIEGGPRPPVFAKKPGEDPGEFPAYGADAVRFGLLAMSSVQDVRFSEERVQQGQQLANKLFNATRFVLSKVGEAPAEHPPAPVTLEDRWILSRLTAFQEQTDEHLRAFDFSKAALGLYDFVYGELCDWYLELIKAREVDADLSALLAHVLRTTLATAHPFIPFVTEDLWAHVPGADGLLAAAEAPAADLARRDPDADAAIAAVIGAVQAVRGWRDGAQIKPGAFLPARLRADLPDGAAALIARLARLAWTEEGEAAAAVPVPGGLVEILASDDVDPAKEAAKRDARIAELRQEIARAEGKLGNAGFVAKAPEAVVAAEREKLARLQAELADLGGA